MHLSKLQILQNKALRTILDVPVYVPRRYLHKELKILPVNSRIKQLSTKFHNQTTSHNNPTIQAQSNVISRLKDVHKYPVKTTQLRTKNLSEEEKERKKLEAGTFMSYELGKSPSIAGLSGEGKKNKVILKKNIGSADFVKGRDNL
ncbi:hypothetical protein TNCV_3422751 [Trichonephila clavipes]|nr:hypothetical protein TNCV_3422751 [Trichonephila clavipes]